METAGSPRWRSWVLLLVCALSGLAALFGFLTLGAFGVVTKLNPAMGAQGADSAILVFLAWESLAVAAFCVPIVVISVRELLGRPTPARPNRHGLRNASIGLGVWVVLVGLFYLLDQHSGLSWLLLPPLAAIATALPIWWLVEYSRRRSNPAPAARNWGLVGFSLSFTMPAVLVISLVALVAVAILIVVILSSRPEIMGQLKLYAQLYANPNGDPQAMLDSLYHIVQQPGVLLWLFAIISGVIPLIEEGLKTLAIWLFAGDRMTPAEGFVAGILCGASFAFLESFSAVNSATSDGGSATAALLVRVGTSLLHITTAGLIGWGIASAVHDWRNLYKLALAYLGGVVLHGTWNAASIMAGVSTSLLPLGINSNIETALADVAIFILGLLVLINLSILSGFNRHFFPKQPLSAVGETSAGPLALDETASTENTTNTSEGTLPGDRPDDE